MFRRTITTFGLAAVLAVAAMPVEAQGRRQAPSLDDQMAQLTEQLDLTEEQQPLVRTVLEEQGMKRQEVFQASGGDRQAMRSAMVALNDETTAKLGEILDEAQMALYTKILEERMSQRRPPFQVGP